MVLIVRKVENGHGFFVVDGQTNKFLQFKLANVLESWFFLYQIL